MAKGDKFGMGSVGSGFSGNYSGWSPEVGQYVQQVMQTQPMDYKGSLRNYDQRRAIEWANQQKMSDPSYWAQAFGIGGGSSGSQPYEYQERANPYQARLNALLDNPDSIANTGVYKFALGQGQEAVNRNLAAKGLLKSGNRLAELTKFGQGLASQQYGSEADRLSKLYGIGEQSNVARESAAMQAQIEREKAQNQMKLSMLGNVMQRSKRYMAPGIHETPGGIATTWD